MDEITNDTGQANETDQNKLRQTSGYSSSYYSPPMPYTRDYGNGFYMQYGSSKRYDDEPVKPHQSITTSSTYPSRSYTNRFFSLVMNGSKTHLAWLPFVPIGAIDMEIVSRSDKTLRFSIFGTEYTLQITYRHGVADDLVQAGYRIGRIEAAFRDGQIYTKRNISLTKRKYR